MVPDFFNSDAFSMTALTAAINEATEGQAAPSVADDIFEEEGVSTSSVFIEMRGDTLSLVPAAPYGAPGDPTSLNRRKVKQVDLIHLPTTGAVMAYEVQGVRAFGSEDMAEVFEQKRDQVLAKMRRRIDVTRRYHRVKSLQGSILDADGSTELLNVFTFFGVTQQTKSFALSTATTNVKKAFEEAKEMSEDALGDSTSIRGFRAYCGREWYNDFSTHAKIEAAFERWDSGAFLRDSQSRAPFSAFDCEFHKLYGNVGGKLWIPAGEAYLVPIVEDPEAYITRYGPADYADTVNTMGLPYYASAEPMPHNKGVSLEAQSNVINLPTRPRSIIKLTKT